MKVPVSWLKQFISFTCSVEEVAERLGQLGLEIEAIHSMKPSFSGVVVAKVLDTQPHPSADRLCIATVFDGQTEYQVVCGAPNCRPNLITAFARIGATLADPTGKQFTIKKATLRGIESSGMLCSEEELGLAQKNEGIIELSEVPIGVDLATFFADDTLEIYFTPNLNYCANIFGIARELGASLAKSISLPKVILPKGEAPATKETFRVHIPDTSLCPRYLCRLIRNVRVGPSPFWLQKRLEQCGLRSVSNIVDVTNYVLWEFGHPLHAFDAATLKGNALFIQPAENGETTTTLDGKRRTLSSDILTIRDAQGVVALAGVMGCQHTEVTEATQSVLLESAFFNPRAIHRSSKALNLETEGSRRFARSCDPNMAPYALDRACELILQVAGGELALDPIDTHPESFAKKKIACRVSRTNALLGTQLSANEIETLLKRLDCLPYFDGHDALIVEVPTYRADLQAEVDLIEEVARLHGYHHIAKEGVSYKGSTLPHTPLYLLETEARDALLKQGLQELLTCDLIKPAIAEAMVADTIGTSALIRLLNPASEEQSVLRPSLLPGLLHVIKYNQDHQKQTVAGYEVGRIHQKINGHYKEQSSVGVILTGEHQPRQWNGQSRAFDFWDIKGIVEAFLKSLHCPPATFALSNLACLHPGQQAQIVIDTVAVGSLGSVHPQLLRQCGIQSPVYFAELNLHDLIRLRQTELMFTSIPTFPGSERDWTITLPEQLPFEQLRHAVLSANSPLLHKLELLGIYHNPALGLDKKNVTLRFSYLDLTKTISKESVDAEHNRIITFAQQQLPL